MATLKYTVIKSREQYDAYCNALESLLSKPSQSKSIDDEAELLTTLIEVWDRQHSQTKQLDPVQLLRSFAKDHKLKPADLMSIMGINSRGHLYEILNYQKGLSKEVIRRLAAYFKVSQEGFNRHYPLKMSRAANTTNKMMKKASAKTKSKVADRNRLKKGLSKAA